jgi:hypothetical protein
VFNETDERAPLEFEATGTGMADVAEVDEMDLSRRPVGALSATDLEYSTRGDLGRRGGKGWASGSGRHVAGDARRLEPRRPMGPNMGPHMGPHTPYWVGWTP